ncbi:MAG: HYC_CC_PP family protein [Bacteroidia bacterium]
MQRFIASILLLLYSTANFGLSLRLDYCGDALSDFALYSTESGISECCQKMGSAEDCCNSKQVYLQESSDKIQLSGSISVISLAGLIIYPGESFFPALLSTPYFPEFPVDSKAPPLNRRSQVLFSCFLI